MVYRDRKEAGEKLASILFAKKYFNPIVFGLTRGGVPIGDEVAHRIYSRLELIVVRKLGMPEFPELGFGAIAPKGVLVIDESLVDLFGLDHDQIKEVVDKEKHKLTENVKKYNIHHSENLHGHTAVIVDDGIATGASMLAAIRYLKKFKPSRVVVAVPVCPTNLNDAITKEADEFICLSEEVSFSAVGQFYEEFDQVSDKEVKSIMGKYRELKRG